MDLKQILARQPGPEVNEQLLVYQRSLKEKTKKMKVWRPVAWCDSELQYQLGRTLQQTPSLNKRCSPRMAKSN